MGGKTVYLVLAGVAAFALIAYGSFRYFGSSGTAARPLGESPAEGVGTPPPGETRSSVPGGQGSEGWKPLGPPSGSGLPGGLDRAVPIGESPLLSRPAPVPGSAAPSPPPLDRSGPPPLTKQELEDLARERRRDKAIAEGRLEEYEAREKALEERKALREARIKARKEWRAQDREARRLQESLEREKRALERVQ